VGLGESSTVRGREQKEGAEIYIKRRLMVCTSGETELG
jgi:hypothetical protein